MSYWMKCTTNCWCSFWNVNLEDQYFNNLNGVYIIWYYDDQGVPRTFRVGQGNIKDRTNFHRSEYRQQYGNWDLYITCTEVDMRKVDGVERYLHNVLNPLIDERSPNVIPISIDLPELFS